VALVAGLMAGTAQAQTTLRMTWYSDGNEGEVMKDLLGRFEKANPDIKVVFAGAVTLYDNLAIPTGAKNPEAATAFLQYVAQHSTQTALTELFPYGMGTVGDAPKLDDQAKGFFPDTYADQLLMQDAGWWGANDAAVNDRLTALFSQ
jgi:ABC-type glycerol-3-phosphate transport system substrate-binding protein